MSLISGQELRTRVEWARNNGKASQQAGQGVRFEHEGRTYLIPAKLLVVEPDSDIAQIELDDYLVHD